MSNGINQDLEASRKKLAEMIARQSAQQRKLKESEAQTAASQKRFEESFVQLMASIIVSATRQKNVREKNKRCHFSLSHFSVWSVRSGRNDDRSPVD